MLWTSPGTCSFADVASFWGRIFLFSLVSLAFFDNHFCPLQSSSCPLQPTWVIHDPACTLVWHSKLLFDFWHQPQLHNSLMLLWGRQQCFSRQLAGLEKHIFQCIRIFHLGISVIFSFWVWSSIQRNWFWSSSSGQHETETLQNDSDSPQGKELCAGLIFPNLACDLSAKGPTSISLHHPEKQQGEIYPRLVLCFSP